jgi:hypothetical protein
MDFGVEPMTRIETYRVFGLCVALAAGGWIVQSCSDSGSGSGAPNTTSGAAGSTTGAATTGAATTGAATTTTGGSTGTGGAGGSDGGGSKAVAYCMPAYPEPLPITSADVTDFDSDATPLLVNSITPGGVWMTDTDGAGTPRDQSMALEMCGTNGTGLHFHGVGHTGWGADVAAAIISQLQPADVSAYSGMSFVMKSLTGTPTLIFKVQNPYAQPGCGFCVDSLTPPAGLECYAGFIKNIGLTANSTDPIVVRWSELAQQGWGYKASGVTKFDPNNLISIAFAFDSMVDFDVCIDDVKFIP